MKLKTIFHRAAAGALCLLLCVSSLAQTALAIEAPGHITGVDFDENRNDCSLTVRYRDYDDVIFKVYRVAGVDANVRYNWDRQADQNNRFYGKVPAYGKDVTDWWSLARDLAGYATTLTGVEGRELAGTLEMKNSTVKRDSNGEVYRELTLSNLYPGLYLVVGSSHEVPVPGSTEVDYISPTPILVSVPTWMPGANGSGSWQKNVFSDLRNKVSDPRSRKNLQVTKSWTNNGYSQPASATVALYCNGVQYGDPVVLSSANNWKYTWKDLDIRYDWWVQEINVPRGYIAASTWVDEYNVAIANVHVPNPGGGGSTPPSGGTYPPGSNPPSTPRPTPDISIDDPDVPLGNKTPPPNSTPKPSGDDEIEIDDPDVPLGDLPQTGQLWWPVPLLAVLGMVLMLIGLIRHRRGEYDEE